MRIKFNQPQQWAVYQRNHENQSLIPIKIIVKGWKISLVNIRLDFRYKLMNVDKEWVEWQEIEPICSTKMFRAIIMSQINLMAGGWYAIQIKVSLGDKKSYLLEIEHVGVGDIFITAGQSNSANSGTTLMIPKSGKVTCWTKKRWRIAHDPQPIANGDGGTPWPVLGDILVEKLEIPIAFISVGWGGTSVTQWQPQNSLYPRLEHVLSVFGFEGIRAVLWHQGESDSIEKTTTNQYRDLLQNIINQSQLDADGKVKWVIAKAAFHVDSTEEIENAVVAGQKAVVNNANVFEGPTTDDLLGEKWRAPDLVHFNEDGLKEHGRRWAKILLNLIKEEVL
jgi:Carbohydrate esterase, sialic acid-specific acetylesterase